MKKQKHSGTLRFKDGRELTVTGESDRYWLCEGTQFRKSNPAIAEFLPAEKKESGKRSADLTVDSEKREGDTDAHSE